METVNYLVGRGRQVRERDPGVLVLRRSTEMNKVLEATSHFTRVEDLLNVRGRVVLRGELERARRGRKGKERKNGYYLFSFVRGSTGERIYET